MDWSIYKSSNTSSIKGIFFTGLAWWWSVPDGHDKNFKQSERECGGQI